MVKHICFHTKIYQISMNLCQHSFSLSIKFIQIICIDLLYIYIDFSFSPKFFSNNLNMAVDYTFYESHQYYKTIDIQYNPLTVNYFSRRQMRLLVVRIEQTDAQSLKPPSTQRRKFSSINVALPILTLPVTKNSRSLKELLARKK